MKCYPYSDEKCDLEIEDANPNLATWLWNQFHLLTKETRKKLGAQIFKAFQFPKDHYLDALVETLTCML